MELRFESPAVRIERVARARLIAWLVLCVLIVLTPFTLQANLCMVAMLGILVDAGVLAVLYAEPRRDSRSIRSPRGAITSSDAGLSVEQEGAPRRRFARRDIVEGWVETVLGGPRVAIRLASSDVVTAEIPDEEAGQELLRAAGLSAEQRVMRVKLTSLASQQWHGEFFRVLGLLGLGPAFPVLALFAVTAALRSGHDARSWGALGLYGLLLALDALGLYRLVRGLAAPTATIGTDGVSIRVAGRARFVPFASVTRVELSETGVRLRLPGDGAVVLPVDSLGARHDARRRQLFDRIREAMTGAGKAGAIAARLEVLDRKGRDVGAWHSALIGLLRAGAGYRGVPLDREDLAHVVEDPRITPERRVAAAVALSTEVDPEIQRRVRLAIDACADDELRGSLERAAEGEIDEAAVERASESQRAPRATP